MAFSSTRAGLVLSILVLLVLRSLVSVANAADVVLHNVTYIADDRTGLHCYQPKNAVPAWRLGRHDKQSYACRKHPTENAYWTMLNAYRSGGTKGKHWKFSVYDKDRECLVDWTHYGKDGVWIAEHVKGRLTRKGDPAKRLWCALPVAHVDKKTKAPTGVEGRQWAFCTCTDHQLPPQQ